MKIQRTFALLPLLGCLSLVCLNAVWLTTVSASPQPTTTSVAGSPVVHKIDPPNWSVNYTPEVTLLLTGENLSGARVANASKGIVVVGTKASSNGHYLFVQLKVSSSNPETAKLALTTPSGSTSVQFPLLARADSRSRFEGFTRNDVIYLIMPDRFADGDPANDQPAGSTGVYDRGNPRAYHGGDLRGIREHLGYLRDLGVTTLWLTPSWKDTDSDYHD